MDMATIKLKTTQWVTLCINVPLVLVFHVPHPFAQTQITHSSLLPAPQVPASPPLRTSTPSASTSIATPRTSRLAPLSNHSHFNPANLLPVKLMRARFVLAVLGLDQRPFVKKYPKLRLLAPCIMRISPLVCAVVLVL